MIFTILRVIVDWKVIFTVLRMIAELVGDHCSHESDSEVKGDLHSPQGDNESGR